MKNTNENVIKGQDFNNNLVEPFFTKKRIIIFSISTALLIAFIALTVVYLFDINFNAIGQLISESYNNNNLFFLWFFMLLTFPIFFILWRIYIYWYKLKKDGIRIKWYDWLCFSCMGAFLNAITPFAIGNEPYTIFWLRSHGVSVKRAAVIVASTGIFGSFIQVLITWPSFFIISASYSADLGTEYLTAYWFGFTGLTLDLLALVFYWLLSYSRKAHVICNRIWHFIRRKFKMSYKTVDEIKHEFFVQASFKKEFMAELKDVKFSIILVVGNLVWNLLFYVALIFSFLLLNPGLELNYFDIFNYTNVAITANNFIPIPGGEGTIQFTIRNFMLQDIGNNVLSDSQWKVFIDNSVFIWRLFTSYVLSFLGLTCFPISVKMFWKIYKKPKQKNKKNINKST